jgi:preprotein translocase subunit YajC
MMKLIQAATFRVNNESKFKKILKKIIVHFEWNMFTRFYIEGYMEFSFTSMLSLSYSSLNDYTLLVDLIITLLFFLLTFITPFYLIIFMTNRYQELECENFKLRWISLYDGFRLSENTIIFNVVFLGRRFLYAVSIVFLGSSPPIQIISCSLVSYFSFFYILIYRPYTSRKENILNCFSELCTFGILSILFAFNFKIGDIETEYIDYAIVVLLHLTFLVPVSVNLIESVVSIIKKIKQYLITNMVSSSYVINDSVFEFRGKK